MADLSPAAQVVLDAVREICPAPADEIAAAALRAVADQVGHCIIYDDDDKDYMVDVADLLAIAAELETSTTENP